MKQLVLASQSPRRKMLLEQVGMAFSVFPSDVDESEVNETEPKRLVEVLSSRKAVDVAEKLLRKNVTNTVVLAADTVVVFNGHILGKPEREQDAYEMLSMLSGNWHEVITGMTVMDVDSGEKLTRAEKTRVKIRVLTQGSIRNYISTGEAFDKAGAYGIQGYGALLVERLEGCYFNVVGLPIYSATALLAQMGVHTLLGQP